MCPCRSKTKCPEWAKRWSYFHSLKVLHLHQSTANIFSRGKLIIKALILILSHLQFDSKGFLLLYAFRPSCQSKSLRFTAFYSLKREFTHQGTHRSVCLWLHRQWNKNCFHQVLEYEQLRFFFFFYINVIVICTVIAICTAIFVDCLCGLIQNWLQA